MKTCEAQSLGIDRKSQGGTDDAEKKNRTFGSKIFTQHQEEDYVLATGALQVASLPLDAGFALQVMV